ncbi:MAG: hypothetical protein ACOCVF_03840 [bacterium]
MKNLTSYDSFLLEKRNNILAELESLFFLPFDERKKLEVDLKKLGYTKESMMNEGFIQNILDRLNKWLTDKALKYLINNKGRMLPKMLDGLKVIDPTDLTSINKIDAMYLGGGIDFAIDEGKGWREQVEEFFGENHVIKGQDIKDLGEGKSIKKSKYSKPMLLNPLNNEPDRSDPDSVFAQMFQKWKKGELNTATPEEVDPKDWNLWVNEINKEIKLPDLHIMNFCDSNLVKYDLVAGDGTKGELQMSDWKGHYVFLWLGQKTLDGNMYQVQNVSPWSLPLATKILRGDEEAWIFLNEIKKKFSK